MLRIVVFGLLVIVAATAFVKIWAARGRIDWTGITFMIGFIVIAFYLHHVTGIG